MNGAYPINYFLLRLLKFHSNDDILNEDEKAIQKEIIEFINNIFLLTRFQGQKYNIRYKPKSKLKEVTVHPISFLHNYATNKYKNIFKFYFDYLLKESLIDIFTRLYPFNKNILGKFCSILYILSY
jgi:hypothetical protein